jgi:hypothetical protein
MKKYWKLILGILLVLGGFGSFSEDIGAAVVGILLGGALMFWHTKPKKAATPSNHKSASFASVWGNDMGGYTLAYKYDDVVIYPPWDLIKDINFDAVSSSPALGLVAEPSNEYDSKAVAVYWGQTKIGYLLKGTLQNMTHDYFRRGWPVVARFVSVELDGANSTLLISLAFYKPNSLK